MPARNRPKYVEAAALYRLGLSYRDIARLLYPSEYQLAVVDKRVMKRLLGRVARLLNEARNHGLIPRGNREEYDWERVEFDDLGGDPRQHERYQTVYSVGDPVPARRKAGLRGVERQAVEYEQYMYRLARMIYGRGLDMTYWHTARQLHHAVFPEFYHAYNVNVWSHREAGVVAKSYAYVVLRAAAGFLGVPFNRARAIQVIYGDPREYAAAEPLRSDIARIVAPYLLNLL